MISQVWIVLSWQDLTCQLCTHQWLLAVEEMHTGMWGQNASGLHMRMLHTVQLQTCHLTLSKSIHMDLFSQPVCPQAAAASLPAARWGREFACLDTVAGTLPAPHMPEQAALGQVAG